MKPHQIYQATDPVLIQEMFTTFRDEEREIYKTAIASLAQSRKLRPVFVQKKPVAAQIEWAHKTLGLRSSDTIGEHLLQVWFMKFHQPMLVEFCDGMGIEHNGEGSVEGALPEEIDPAKLKTTSDALFAKYNPKLVSLYLTVFNLQTPEGWVPLSELLATDPRIHLGTGPAPATDQGAPEEPSVEESEPDQSPPTEPKEEEDEAAETDEATAT